MIDRRRIAAAVGVAMLLVWTPVTLHAQRQLHWDALEVTARLDADGVLHVSEMQTMVFTGDWNGGERTFNLRPYHRVALVSVERLDPTTGARRAMREDDALDDVDDFALREGHILRWRSRLPGDPAFSATRLAYAISYTLSRILLKEDHTYRLDHDFAFPDRAGAIDRFSLQLTLDPAWEPLGEVRERYTAGPLPPDRSFVLNVPLRLRAGGSVLAADTRRPPAATAAVWTIVAATLGLIVAFFRRESRLGRFARVDSSSIDERWIAANVVSLPAEVVGAAWDGDVGPPEVVALLARMVAEGTLTSESAADGSMALTLNVDRGSLSGYEKALVHGLFFDGGTETSTDRVKAHYKSKGFNPTSLIATGLKARVKDVLPSGDEPEVTWYASGVLLTAVFALFAFAGMNGDAEGGSFTFIVFTIGAGLLAKLPGIAAFRRRVDWGRLAAVICLIPALIAVAILSVVLSSYAAIDGFAMPTAMIWAAALLAIWIVHTALNAMKSREHRDAIAFRKRLAAGRAYFKSQLSRNRPSMRDDWYPWVLAYGLGKVADRWSTRYAGAPATVGAGSGSWRGDDSSTPSWTGAGGGRSGGAGGGAAWAAAAAGMAAGVSPPSSSSSGGGSGGGSSGGGGGGGW